MYQLIKVERAIGVSVIKVLKLLLLFNLSYSCNADDSISKSKLISFVNNEVSKDKNSELYKIWLKRIDFDMKVYESNIESLSEEQVTNIFKIKNLFLECILSSYMNVSRGPYKAYLLEKKYKKALLINKTLLKKYSSLEARFSGKSWTNARSKELKKSCENVKDIKWK